MDTIKIKSKLYDYEVNFISSFSEQIDKFEDTTVYVIDKNIYKLYHDHFKKIDLTHVYFMTPAEEYKNMETVLDIIGFWQTLGVRKNWKAVCIGGGITQDVTTIAADLFLRNIDWYFFPTTLLSMCDSCIGGKCGINLKSYKNQIGVFYPPKRIFIDTGFLKTLSELDYVNGWGELLKFSLTLDFDFYEELKREESYIPCDRIGYYIKKGLEVKKKVIEEDEFESDFRRVLNYGHTFGHALEAYTEYQVPHGKAVIWGIDVVNYIAWKKGMIDESLYFDVKALIKQAFIPKEIVIKDPEILFETIKTDKKVRGNTLSFALLNKDRQLCVCPIEIDNNLKSIFIEYLETTNEYYRN